MLIFFEISTNMPFKMLRRMQNIGIDVWWLLSKNSPTDGIFVESSTENCWYYWLPMQKHYIMHLPFYLKKKKSNSHFTWNNQPLFFHCVAAKYWILSSLRIQYFNATQRKNNQCLEITEAKYYTYIFRANEGQANNNTNALR